MTDKGNAAWANASPMIQRLEDILRHAGLNEEQKRVALGISTLLLKTIAGYQEDVIELQREYQALQKQNLELLKEIASARGITLK